ncbi:MAG TPA: hypothetical protein VLA88_04210 [Candidatus Saccharimonadales bacterium]|nr:hypothetical protein [Candidatus Saccharimonadales bacterium]
MPCTAAIGFENGVPIKVALVSLVTNEATDVVAAGSLDNIRVIQQSQVSLSFVLSTATHLLKDPALLAPYIEKHAAELRAVMGPAFSDSEIAGRAHAAASLASAMYMGTAIVGGPEWTHDFLRLYEIAQDTPLAAEMTEFMASMRDTIVSWSGHARSSTAMLHEQSTILVTLLTMILVETMLGG